MGVEPRSPPTANLLSACISPNEDVILELDCTSMTSVVLTPTIKNFVAISRKFNEVEA